MEVVCVLFPPTLFFFLFPGKRGEKKSGFAPSFLENDCGGHGCGKDKEEEEKGRREGLFSIFSRVPFLLNEKAAIWFKIRRTRKTNVFLALSQVYDKNIIIHP